MEDREKYLKYKKKYLELKERAQYLKEKSDRRMNGGAATNVFPIEDEIFFWSRQMMEHLQLIWLGLEDPEHKLKDAAFQQYRQWRDFIKSNFVDRGIELKPDLVTLTPEQLQLVAGKINQGAVAALIDSTSAYQGELLDVLNKNIWIGWIFPSLANHMQKETMYFGRKLNGPAFTPDEEIAFINQHHSEELNTTAHLLDPAPENIPLVMKAHAYASKTMPNWTEADKKILQGKDVTEQATLLRVSIKYGDEIIKMAQELGTKIDNHAIKSIISPVLAHHELREFIRFNTTLQALQAAQK